MEKHNLLVFTEDLSHCKCCDSLEKEYVIFYTLKKEEFLENLKQENVDACIICFASSKIKINEVFDKSDLSTKLPVLMYSDKINSEYIDLAVKYGVNRFVTYNMCLNELNKIITESISLGRVKAYLKSLILNKLEFSSYSGKFINIIIKFFPKRLHENEIAKQLNISVRYLQKMCMKCFNRGYNQLLRRIRVYNALRLMDNTGLNNYEIRFHLKYSECSSMSRDFEKELNCSLNEARKFLITYHPKDIMLNSLYLVN